MKKLILIVLVAGFAPAAYCAELYKWTDALGNIHYSDQPPPKEIKSFERIKAVANVIEGDALPFDTKVAAAKHPVTLYSYDSCSECTKAEDLLNKRGLPYTLKNREEDKAELKKLTGGLQVPVLIVGNQSPLKGFDESAWNSLLDLAGYPKSNPLSGLRPTKPVPPVPTPSAEEPGANDQQP